MASFSDPRLPGFLQLSPAAIMIALVRVLLVRNGSAPAASRIRISVTSAVDAAFRNGVEPAVRFGLPAVSYFAGITRDVMRALGFAPRASRKRTRSTLSISPVGFGAGRLYQYSYVCMSTAAKSGVRPPLSTASIPAPRSISSLARS